MKAKAQPDSTSKNSQVFSFKNEVKMSAFQPISISPQLGRDWILNGENNANYITYKNAYDDSPTNQSIINAFTNYIFAEGLFNVSTISDINIERYISQNDILLLVQDYKMYGGFSIQIIWDSNEGEKKPLKLEYIPIYKLGLNYVQESLDVNGYWYSWDWSKRFLYNPKMYPKFTGRYTGNDLEILVVKRPSSEPFFPIPDYISGVPWAQVEGELGNAAKHHFQNAMSDITVINYNSGRQSSPEAAREEADKVRNKVVGTNNQSAVLVSFNEGIDEAVIVDKISPPEINQQNVFYSEEAERKLIVAHSAPPILFSGTNTGGGFSSNADEIEVATKALYRRHINPMRKTITRGLSEVFNLIDITIKLEFLDFEEEDLEVLEDSKIEEEVKEKSLMQKIFR